MAQGWSQRPNFVPIRLNELFNGLRSSTPMTTCWPWSAGWAGGTSRKCGCSCCAMTTRCAIRCSGGSSRWKAAARSRWPTSTSSRARNSTGTTRSCCWPTKARWSGPRAARLPGGAQPGFLRLSRRLVLARVCVPGAHARRNGGGPAAAAPVPGFVDHRHCLAGRQAAGGPAQARPARRRALRASLRRRFSGPKAAALSVLRMLEALGARAAVESDAVAQALALGLGHPHADVQRAAVKALAAGP